MSACWIKWSRQFLFYLLPLLTWYRYKKKKKTNHLQELNLHEERYRIVSSLAKKRLTMDSSHVTSICNPFDKLQGGIHQSTKIIHLVEGRWKQFMRPFVFRVCIYSGETICLPDAKQILLWDREKSLFKCQAAL